MQKTKLLENILFVWLNGVATVGGPIDHDAQIFCILSGASTHKKECTMERIYGRENNIDTKSKTNKLLYLAIKLLECELV